MVLSDLSGGVGQGRRFRHAFVQTNRRIVDHCQPDAAQDPHCHGTPDSIYRLHDLIEMDDALIGGAPSLGKAGARRRGQNPGCWWPLRAGTSAPASLPCNRCLALPGTKWRSLSSGIFRLANGYVAMHCLRCGRSARPSTTPRG